MQPMPLQPGSILAGRYRIEDKLGRGGMGAVYLAYDQTLNMRVAVKENLNANPESERQFRKEAELLAKLRHPHLPRVTDYFILEDQQYLVMDYVEGIDLHARAAQKPPTVDEVLRWAGDLGSALTYLHTRTHPIIHRDIKPSNVKVQPDGTLFLVDFGIAKIYEHDQVATTTGARGLTPGYSPPEQYGGARTDARSDQYALAATLYSLMTRQSPPDSIERMLNKEHLRPASSINPQVPSHVDAALERAMAVDMEDRFPDIATFMAALRGDETVAVRH
jgi:serine/threonine-protein kinase